MTDKEEADVLQALLDGTFGVDDAYDVIEHAIARLEQPAPTGDLVSLEAAEHVVISAQIGRFEHVKKAVAAIRALPRATSVDEVGQRLEANSVEGLDCISIDVCGNSDGDFWSVVRDTLPEALAALLADVEKS
jgi:hypothetical protein